MTTTLAYVCDDCGRECVRRYYPDSLGVWCEHCHRTFQFAPWSYAEPIRAAGLEALFRQICAERLRAGIRLPTKEEFLKQPGALFVTPLAILHLIATGIEFHAAPQVAPPAPAPLHLVR